MELSLLKTTIEEKILRNIPAEIDKKFLNFLDEYKSFFGAIDENNLSQIEIELKFYTPNRTFDTRLLVSPTSSTEAEINISNRTLKDFAPSVRVTISVHTYENIKHRVKDFYRLDIGETKITYTGNINYIYIIQRLISLDRYFIMEYFL
jgi:6-pyruvoyl-tetrahydropterin synthase